MRRASPRPALLAGVCIVSLLSAPLLAQTTSGGIRGAVTDASGAVVPGATVIGRNAATNVENRTVTSSEGIYQIPRLIPGRYVVTVEVPGFKKAEVTNVAVSIGQDAVLDVRLDPGAAAETITVEGTGVTLVQADTVQISATFEAKKVQDLPINTP